MESTVRESEGFLDTEEESEPGARERCIIGKLERRRGWTRGAQSHTGGPAPLSPPLSAPCHPAPPEPAYYPCICLITLTTYNYTNFTT